jgi:hypothetical protein
LASKNSITTPIPNSPFSTRDACLRMPAKTIVVIVTTKTVLKQRKGML